MPVTKKQEIDAFNEKYNLNNVNLKLFNQATFDVESKSAEIAGKPTKTWQDVVRRFFRNKWNIFFLLVILTLFAITIIAPLVSEYTATQTVAKGKASQIGLADPSWTSGFGSHYEYLNHHDYNALVAAAKVDPNAPQILEKGVYVGHGNWKVLVSTPLVEGKFLPFGTDAIGRDVWTKLWVGTAWSLRLAFTVAAIETVIGVSIGIYLGMHVGKPADTITMRIVEIFSSVPALIWMVMFSLVLGTGFWAIAGVLILVGWVGPVYQARMFTVKVKDAEFIKAARVSGTSNVGIIYKHILPNIIGRLIVGFVQRIPAVIFFEASLVFLGFQVGGADGITLGNIINTARSHVLEQPWDIVSAAAVILTITISLQILANGLRDAFDAKVAG